MDILAFDGVSLLTQWVWPILLFGIGLGLVIFVHELGHFLAAKRSGIKCEEFALGFGKRLLGIRRGETEYRVNILPLGGYVKMLGQDDFKPETGQQTDPRAWQNAAVHKRLLVLSAGVAMNVVFAALLFVAIYMIGIRFAAPVVGGVDRDLPAGKVELPPELASAMGKDKGRGLRPGDRVEAIDGVRTRTFEQVYMAAALSNEGQRFDFTLTRRLEGQDVTFTVPLEPKRTESDLEGARYAFGIAPAPSTVIDEPAAAGYAGTERFAKGDRIAAIDGKGVEHYWDMIPILAAVGSTTVAVTVIRDGAPTEVPCRALLYSKDDTSKNYLTILGMSPRVVVSQVEPHSPADRAGLRPGDVIAGYGDQGAPCLTELLELNKQLQGSESHISVLRDGEQLALTIVPTEHDNRALIGILSLPEQSQAYVAKVEKDSPADTAGIRPGAVITSVNGQAVKGWPEVFVALRAAAGREVSIGYTFGALGQEASLGQLTGEQFDSAQYVFGLPALALSGMKQLMTAPIRGNPLEALAWSARDTGDFIARTYLTLKRLAERRVSVKSLRGPVGIGDAYIRIAREDFMHMLYFTAMLSVIVAVMNFLPLPALDGGLVLLVLIEKIRGRPLPLKVQAGFQIAGLLMFLGIFLAVTWNDISRLLPHW